MRYEAPLAVAATLSICASGWADGAARAVLEEAVAAHEAVITATYTGVYSEYELQGDEAVLQATQRGRVTYKRDDRDEIMHACVRIEFESREDLVVYCDGVETHLLPEFKRAIISRGGSVGLIGGFGTAALLDESFPVATRFPLEKLKRTVQQATLLRLEGRAEVAGVMCDVVYFERPNDMARLHTDAVGRFFVGVDDHLVHRSVRGMKRAGELVPAKVELTMRNLQVNVDLPADTFLLPVPEGYERHERVSEFYPRPEPLPGGAMSPDWELADASGVKHRFADYKGEVLLLDFWGTWCAPCIKAMPAVQELHERFSQRGVTVIGISCQEKPGADPATFMKERGFDYGLLLEGDAVSRAFGVTGFPAFYIIGVDGRIIHRHVGLVPDLDEFVGQLIQDYLDERGR